MKLKEFCCPNCKAPLTPVKDARYMYCQYCGTRIVIDDIDYYREDSKTERKKIQTEADIQKHAIDSETKKHGQEMHHETIMAILSFLVLALFLLFCIFTEAH